MCGCSWRTTCGCWLSFAEDDRPARIRGRGYKPGLAVNCDRLAPWYRWMEYLGMGRALERRRWEFLPEAADARRVLMLGEGDGRFLAAFLKRNPRAEVDYVDLSARMLALAEERAHMAVGAANVAGRVHFHHTNACVWPMPTGATYDLIVTHFFLDCFTTEQLAPLLDRLALTATADARWIVSEFHQPAHGITAWRARFWISGLYTLFRFATGLRVRVLPAYRPLLQACGFEVTHAVTADAGLLISELWQRS